MGKLVFGVGINDSSDPVTRQEKVNGKWKTTWMCPYYRRWAEMLRRCYSEDVKRVNPTYEGCNVSEDWKLFSNFKAWMKKQSWKGLQLDKDVLLDGNKLYSETTCVFIHNIVNTFLSDSGRGRGRYLLGASLDKRLVTKPYRSQVSNPFTKKLEYLGMFSSEQEAHQAWRARKYELAVELSKSIYVTDERVATALVERFKEYKEKTCTH